MDVTLTDEERQALLMQYAVEGKSWADIEPVFERIVAARLAPLEEELRGQWADNHYEHCSDEWPHPEGRVCYWPLPASLRAEPSETTRD